MKLQELFEMSPQLEPRELPIDLGMHKRFNSIETLKAKYDVISATPYVIGLSKDKTFAMIGKKGVREEDNVDGVFILGTMEFKKPLNISSVEHIDLGKQVLQVDGVSVDKILRRDGIGYFLYFALINAGYTVISDNVQYLGGKAIWKKVARLAARNGYKVYIIQDTEVKMKDGKPEVYNGTNIDDAEIWSSDDKHLHTLLVAEG